jgi:hypothetical protein
MTTGCLIDQLRTLGVTVHASCTRLLVDAPAGAVTPELGRRIRQARPDLIEALMGDAIEPWATSPVGSREAAPVTFWPPDADDWSDSVRVHFLERLGVADELDHPTDPTSPAWGVAVAEARRLQAGIPNALWSNELGLLDATLSAFAGMDFRYKNHIDSN